MKDKSIQELINLYHSGKLTIVEKKVIELIKKNLSLRGELKTAATKYLYNNLKALKEFEQFLEEAHITAQLGNKLKDGHKIRF